MFEQRGWREHHQLTPCFTKQAKLKRQFLKGCSNYDLHIVSAHHNLLSYSLGSPLACSQLAHWLQKLHCRIGDRQGVTLHNPGLEDHRCRGRHPHLRLQRLPREHMFRKAPLQPVTRMSARNLVHVAYTVSARLHG